MPKRIANGLTLLSAVVCVGSALLVGRSFAYKDGVGIRAGPRSAGGAWSVHGQLWLSHTGWLPPHSMRYVRPITFHSQSVRGWGIGVREPDWKYMWGNRWLGVGGGRVLGTRRLILPLWLLP